MSDLKITAEPGKHDVTISRSFDAPRDIVFKAFNDPEAIPNWWGPRKYETIVETLEARPGGIWRFLNVEPDGTSYGFHGVIHDIVAPERAVRTFEFEGV